MIAGTGTRSMPLHRAGTAGRGPGGHVGALGLEVNLFKLGGYGDGRMGIFTSIEPGPSPIAMGGLGASEFSASDDYGLIARRAAADARRSERINRALDQQDAAKRAAERERAIELSQDAFSQAGDVQNLILTSGSENLTKVLRSTMVIGVIALGSFAVTAIFSNLGKKRRDEEGSRLRSYRSKSFRRKATRFSPAFGDTQ